MSIKNRKEQGTLRIVNFHSTFVITDCQFAGKRGKVCRELTIECPEGQYNSQIACDVEHNLSITLESLTTWDQALALAELAKAHNSQVRIHFHEQKSIRVQPLGFEDVVVGNDNYSAHAGYEDFGASDYVDQANCPKWTSTSQQAKADFRKVYDFVKANQDRLNAPEMTMRDFTTAVREATGVSGHGWCSMD